MTYQSSFDPVDGDPRRSIVALFGDRESARNAARELHDENFHRIWMGITHAGDPAGSQPGAGSEMTVESRESLGEKIGRFFSGESDTRTLSDELIRHGISPHEARRIEFAIPPESVVMTVDGSNHPEAAATIIERCDGHVVAGEGFASDATDTSIATQERSGSQILGYGAPDRFARGEQIDEERRVLLRAERLNVDKRQERIGEATVRKDVVSHEQEVDVPLVREELFVQRRAPQTSTLDDADVAVGADRETIRIPLMRERVVVTKRPVVTEEVVVGKRAVTATEHVRETTREEQLRVDDAGTSAERP